ncbi:DUF4112 domain-containing protein [Aestuariibacter sp. AA17]|uniref:DUF4112 domain-containing protein n=1 Tax=Fluctibacter corallii TaxID=2984329 RepID=A0ABT3AD23_9ALTE|nr:DUF4112 domain-containing protein [Aestuariibacter sp. AA17]MCV2886583.1 DUF4112 domain-containing protein [Aestuariibacter sp. AA17]
MNMPHFPPPLREAQDLANMLDTAIRIPFLGIRVGLDFLLGLIPVLGDAITLLISFRIIRLAKTLGVPNNRITAMVRNCVIDFALGFIPFFGDIADIFFKANKANVRMMEQWWLSQHRQDIHGNTQAALEEWEKSLPKE